MSEYVVGRVYSNIPITKEELATLEPKDFKVISTVDSMQDTIRDLLKALDSVKNEQELIHGGNKTTAWQIADKAIKRAS